MRKIFLLCLLFFFPGRAVAFLSDTDPENWIAVAEKAPRAVFAKLLKSQNPTSAQRYYVHELKVIDVLSGSSLESAKVLQEIVFPDEKGVFPEGEFVVFLADLPAYTAYRAAKEQGVGFRIFGGRAGVIALGGPAGAELRSLVRDTVALNQLAGADKARQKRAILFRALAIQDVRIQNDVASVMESLDLSGEKLNSAEANTILGALQSGSIKAQGSLALVRLLQKSGDASSVAALKTLASGPGGPPKWAAIQALETLGMPRSLRELVDDFGRAEESQKARALAVILNQNDEETKVFLKNLLSGSESVVVKREAIAQMERKGGVFYEAILIDQTQNRDETIAGEALLALGRLSSSSGLDRIIQLLDSPSPTLRSAARIALMQNKDPRAVKIFQERFEDKAGHSHGHFY